MTIEHTLGARLPEGLSASAAGAARWASVREFWMPVTTVVRDDDGVVIGAALTMARPGTAYRKIVDVVAETADAFAEVVRAVVSLAAGDTRPEGIDIHPAVVVHVEEHESFDDARTHALHDLGFERQAGPVPSVPSTLIDTPAGVRVWSRWATRAPGRVIPYYGQTTEVTCGAVTALGAMHASGHGAFTADRDDNHSIELAFWRQATNLPACEPVGLAVATREALRDAATSPRVVISTDQPVLLEEYRDRPGERALREDLQAEGRRRAQLLGVPVEHRWATVDEIAERVAAGTPVGILIDLTALIDDPSPHWILAYDVIDGNIIVSDPWVDAENAETWADTFALPLPPATLDLVARWGEPAYRGIVVFAPREAGAAAQA